MARLDRRKKSPLALVKKWRARDRHTGIGRDSGIPYTYQHVEAPPAAAAEVYRIETFIHFTEVPIHRDVYYVPAVHLDGFFEGWGEHGTQVVDIRPMTAAAALEEIRVFQAEAQSK